MRARLLARGPESSDSVLFGGGGGSGRWGGEWWPDVAGRAGRDREGRTDGVLREVSYVSWRLSARGRRVVPAFFPRHLRSRAERSGTLGTSVVSGSRIFRR